MKTVGGEGSEAGQQAGPSHPKQQQKKQHEAPPVLSGGEDVTAGPSQQPQGERKQRPQYHSQPQRQQPLKPPTHDVGRGRGRGRGQAGTGNRSCVYTFLMYLMWDAL